MIISFNAGNGTLATAQHNAMPLPRVGDTVIINAAYVVTKILFELNIEEVFVTLEEIC